MLGFFIGCVWFIFVKILVLRTNNPIKRIFQKLRLKNNMVDDIMYDLNFDGDMDKMTLEKLLEITKKNDLLTKIKEDLKKFTSDLEGSDIIKKMGQKETTKKNS